MSLVDTLLTTAYEDTQLLIKNDGLGDIFSTPRDVDFILNCPSREKAETVSSFVSDNQYGVPTIEGDDSSLRLCITVFMPITQQVLCSVSGFMACLAKLFSLEYDGWGSQIQPDKTSTLALVNPPAVAGPREGGAI